jgi:hypothetical protein
MPKVNAIQLPERIQKRIDELKAGIEVDVKDIRAVLTVEQQVKLDAAWAEQQQLRKAKRATTPAQQQALGWKTKREVRLEILRQAVAEAMKNIVKAFDDERKRAEIRQVHVYFAAYGAAIDGGDEPQHAKNQANNALTRAGLARFDGQVVGHLGLNKRDREIRQMEQEFMEQARSEMTADELEQQDILAEHERSVRERRKKRGF